MPGGLGAANNGAEDGHDDLDAGEVGKEGGEVVELAFYDLGVLASWNERL